jgi:hypothetical protein
MDMDIIALCDSREMEGVDHVQEATGKGKHINGLFENPPLRDVMVSVASPPPSLLPSFPLMI